jgi:hypothetical protein
MKDEVGLPPRYSAFAFFMVSDTEKDKQDSKPEPGNKATSFILPPSYFRLPTFFQSISGACSRPVRGFAATLSASSFTA